MSPRASNGRGGHYKRGLPMRPDQEVRVANDVTLTHWQETLQRRLEEWQLLLVLIRGHQQCQEATTVPVPAAAQDVSKRCEAKCKLGLGWAERHLKAVEAEIKSRADEDARQQRAAKRGQRRVESVESD